MTDSRLTKEQLGTIFEAMAEAPNRFLARAEERRKVAANARKVATERTAWAAYMEAEAALDDIQGTVMWASATQPFSVYDRLCKLRQTREAEVEAARLFWESAQAAVEEASGL